MATTTYYSMITKNNIKIGITGEILEGRHAGWYICIEDDFENTGGYLVFVFNNFNKLNSSEGYDRWAEDKNTLLEMFKSAKWKIRWSDENNQN